MDVFVLEDDPALRFALVQVLEDCGYTAFSAGGICEAFEVLGKIQPDLLLLDLIIGSADSIQVADLAGYRFPDAELVYLTGSNKYPNGELFRLTNNTSWVLRKPIDFEELKAVFQHLHVSMKVKDNASTRMCAV